MNEPLTLTVWSDFLCPWCYVAAIRLEQLEAEYEGKIEIEWKQFLLQPEPRNKPIEKFITYTQLWVKDAGPGGSAPELGFRPWETGDSAPPTHSLPSAIAGRLARTHGKEAFARFHLATMRAYFVEHRMISDPDVLADIASETGLDRAEFRDRLATEGGTLAKEVLAEFAEAHENEVHAVPSVVLNGFPIPGAQELPVYRAMIDRLLAKN